MAKNRAGGGEGGIRTHGTLASTPHFECGAFDHSAPTFLGLNLTGGTLNMDGGSITHTNNITPDLNNSYSVGAPGNVYNGIYGTYLYGTVSTPAQTSITSVGTLSSLSVSGTLTSGNIVSASNTTYSIGTNSNYYLNGYFSALAEQSIPLKFGGWVDRDKVKEGQMQIGTMERDIPQKNKDGTIKIDPKTGNQEIRHQVFVAPEGIAKAMGPVVDPDFLRLEHKRQVVIQLN